MTESTKIAIAFAQSVRLGKLAREEDERRARVKVMRKAVAARRARRSKRHGR